MRTTHYQKLFRRGYSLLLTLIIGFWFAGIHIVEAQQTTRVTTLLTDLSDSMLESDASTLYKIEAAKQAMNTFINAVEADQRNQSFGTSFNEYLSIVGFCTDAYAIHDFTQDFNSLRANITPLDTCGSTNMSAGLEGTLDQLRSAQSTYNASQLHIILLSDGKPDSESAVLQQLPNLNAMNVCLDIVGLGSVQDGTIDIDFLQQMIDAVGCGRLYTPQNANQLNQAYLQSRIQSVSGNIAFEVTDVILPNQQLTYDQVSVPAGQDTLSVNLTWLQGQVGLNLIDPAGQAVSTNYPGASFSSLPNFDQVIVRDPTPGNWQIQLVGSNVPPGGTSFTTVAALVPSTVPQQIGVTLPQNPAPAQIPTTGMGNDSLILFGLMLVGFTLVTGLVVVMMRNRAGGGATAPSSGSHASLTLMSGNMSGQRVPIFRVPFTIGRRAGNALQLQDDRVSRAHAQIVEQNGVFYLQDLGSSSGTFINGQQTAGPHALQNGDNIQIGRIKMMFQLG